MFEMRSGCRFGKAVTPFTAVELRKHFVRRCWALLVELFCVIPERSGAVNSVARTTCDRFVRFPGSVRANAGEGSGSRLDRRSTA
jgi:hypothetical protein